MCVYVYYALPWSCIRGARSSSDLKTASHLLTELSLIVDLLHVLHLLWLYCVFCPLIHLIVHEFVCVMNRWARRPVLASYSAYVEHAHAHKASTSGQLRNYYVITHVHTAQKMAYMGPGFVLHFLSSLIYRQKEQDWRVSAYILEPYCGEIRSFWAVKTIPEFRVGGVCLDGRNYKQIHIFLCMGAALGINSRVSMYTRTCTCVQCTYTWRARSRSIYRMIYEYE